MMKSTFGRLYSRQRAVILLVTACVLILVLNPGLVPYDPRGLSRTPGGLAGPGRVGGIDEFESDARQPPSQQGPYDDNRKLSDAHLGGIKSAETWDTESAPAPHATDSKTSSSHQAAVGRPAKGDYCSHFPDLSDIMIISKTGASEAFDKLPLQIMTFMRCNPDNVLFFSDLEEDMGPYHIYDSLDEVSEDLTDDNRDFDLYRAQKEFKKLGQDPRHMKKVKWTKDAAWTLDKYKNVHVAVKTWRMRPDVKWYLYIDADTYVIWPSLVAWLKTLNPDNKLYMGSMAMMGDMGFAHGGSGYLLSRAAMEALVDDKIAAKYDENAQGECCGDVNLAKAIYEKKMKLSHVWPMINGEKPNTLPFGPSHWCQPIITMHHVSVDEVDSMWHYEQQRKDPSKLVLLKDIYEYFVQPRIKAEIPGWDNISNDQTFKDPSKLDDDKKENAESWSKLQKESYQSFDNCKALCEAEDWCFQFKYSTDHVCGLGNSIKLGTKEVPELDVTTRSGFLMQRIEKWIKEKGGECAKPLWISP